MKRYKVSEHDKKTLSWWYARREKIDFEPTYQRKGGLWTPADKGYLIDSIINEFDIPKIYLADFTWTDSPILNPKKKMYAVIDGKQRLEAMFDFIDNEVALNDDFVFFSDPKIKAAGMKYSDLEKTYPELSEIVDQFNLSVVSVVTEDEEAINELFVRLNRSRALTGAEIRNAMKGDVPRLIREVSAHVFFKENVSFNKQRGQDMNAAAKLLMFEFHGKPKDTKRKDLDAFAGTADYDRRDMELAFRTTLDQLDLMASVFLPRDQLLRSAGLVPVYYWFIRQREETELPLVRAFLTWFDKSRQSLEDESFVLFARYNRSTNDESSFVKRVDILNSKYAEWTADQ